MDALGGNGGAGERGEIWWRQKAGIAGVRNALVQGRKKQQQGAGDVNGRFVERERWRWWWGLARV